MSNSVRWMYITAFYCRRKKGRKSTKEPERHRVPPPDIVPSAPPVELWDDPSIPYVIQDSIPNESAVSENAALENIYHELEDRSIQNHAKQDSVPKKTPENAGDEHIYHVLDEELVEKDIDATHSQGFHVNSADAVTKDAGEKHAEGVYKVARDPYAVVTKKQQQAQRLGQDLEMAENTVYNTQWRINKIYGAILRALHGSK